jgi:hypothetical protein
MSMQAYGVKKVEHPDLLDLFVQGAKSCAGTVVSQNTKRRSQIRKVWKSSHRQMIKRLVQKQLNEETSS